MTGGGLDLREVDLQRELCFRKDSNPVSLAIYSNCVEQMV